ISEEVFWKKLILFHLLDIVQFREISGDKEINKNVDDILGLYDKLKKGRLDYYELLGQEKNATFNGIKDAYFDYAKKYHPDRLAGAPDPDIKEKANFVFAEINKAYETLSNVDKKREYDNKGYRDDLSEDVMQENLTERARMLYRKGKVLYTQKKYWEAVTVLDEAVRHDSRKPAYFLLLGLCQMNVPAQKRMAEKNLQKSIDLEPWNIEALTAMGILFLSENQSNRAEGFFRKALSINPDHSLARKKLQEITNSRTDRKKRSGFSLFGKSKK
ncbi:MAG: DnaJ domain-containing protein, partial [bacterium]|nr:DnaJ domain-containing protein [bacterium]